MAADDEPTKRAPQAHIWKVMELMGCDEGACELVYGDFHILIFIAKYNVQD